VLCINSSAKEARFPARFFLPDLVTNVTHATLRKRIAGNILKYPGNKLIYSAF
jgi:hypothetical protein